MIYIDSKFRFYDDSKDLVTFPELKPIPEAVALTDEDEGNRAEDRQGRVLARKGQTGLRAYSTQTGR